MVTIIRQRPPVAQLRDDPHGFVEALLSAHGLPSGTLDRLEGWSNQVWVAETELV
jgi:hypothetical protein